MTTVDLVFAARRDHFVSVRRFPMSHCKKRAQKIAENLTLMCALFDLKIMHVLSTKKGPYCSTKEYRKDLGKSPRSLAPISIYNVLGPD